jgi:tetratricopeptide (TPR) repeat protein
VIRKDVPFALLQAIAEPAEDELHATIGRLQAREFLYEAGIFPDLEYTFKHALTHEVAYASLLQGRRRMVHSRIVEAIEQRYANRLTEHVERLAHHAYRGQVWDKAVTYLRQAAAKAQGRSAHQQALACLEEALEALRHLPETPETQEQEIDVCLELRGSLYPLGEFEKMLTYLRAAEAMASAISDAHRLGLVSIHTGEYFRQTGRFAEARALAEQALALGDKLQDVPLRLYASHYLGLAYHALGDYRRASELLRTVTQSLQTEWRTGAFGGMVIGSWAASQAITLAWLARCLAERGELEEGVAAGRRAVAIAEGLDSPYCLAAACIGLGYISLVRGDLDAAGRVLERAGSVARDANLTLFRPQATRLLGGVYLLAGRIDEGVALVRAAADEVEARRLLMQHAAVLALLGEACLFADRADEASTAAQRALAAARERGQRGEEVVALRVLGEIASHSDRPDVEMAEDHYHQAIAFADELGMRPLQAHCHRGLGTLYAKISQREQAPRRAVRRHRPVPRHGHDLLAAAGGGSAGPGGGAVMDFYEVLARVIEILQREGRTSYRALKRQFGVDDAYLEDLKVELIEVKQLAVDREGTMLVWTGAA